MGSFGEHFLVQGSRLVLHLLLTLLLAGFEGARLQRSTSKRPDQKWSGRCRLRDEKCTLAWRIGIVTGPVRWGKWGGWGTTPGREEEFKPSDSWPTADIGVPSIQDCASQHGPELSGTLVTSIISNPTPSSQALSLDPTVRLDALLSTPNENEISSSVVNLDIFFVSLLSSLIFDRGRWGSALSGG